MCKIFRVFFYNSLTDSYITHRIILAESESIKIKLIVKVKKKISVKKFFIPFDPVWLTFHTRSKLNPFQKPQRTCFCVAKQTSH